MSAITIIKMSRVRKGGHYRLTQRLLQIKLGEANDLIERLLERGITPDLTLHCVKGGGTRERYVGCHRFFQRRR